MIAGQNYELRLKSPKDGNPVSRAEYYRLCANEFYNDPDTLGDAYKQAEKDVDLFTKISKKLNNHDKTKLNADFDGRKYFLEAAKAMPEITTTDEGERIAQAADKMGLTVGERLIVMHSPHMGIWRDFGDGVSIVEEAKRLKTTFAGLYANAKSAQSDISGRMSTTQAAIKSDLYKKMAGEGNISTLTQQDNYHLGLANARLQQLKNEKNWEKLSADQRQKLEGQLIQQAISETAAAAADQFSKRSSLNLDKTLLDISARSAQYFKVPVVNAGDNHSKSNPNSGAIRGNCI